MRAGLVSSDGYQSELRDGGGGGSSWDKSYCYCRNLLSSWVKNVVVYDKKCSSSGHIKSARERSIVAFASKSTVAMLIS